MGAEHVDEVFGAIGRQGEVLVSPLTLMQRSRQVPQLRRTTNCLLHLINSPTKRANYLTAWTCYKSQPTHMPMDRSIRTRSEARTKNHWWTKLVMAENMYYIGDSGNGECILVLLARCYLILSGSSRSTSDEDQKAFRLVRRDQSQGRSGSDVTWSDFS